MVRECQMTLKLVTNILPRSPEFPFVSSMLSSLSMRTSPGRIFICLIVEEVRSYLLMDNSVNIRQQNVKSDFSVFPDGVHSSSVFSRHFTLIEKQRTRRRTGQW